MVTWSSELELECHFTDYLYMEDVVSCIHISLNGGRTYTEGCLAIDSVRVPLIKIDSFEPVNSHVQDIVWLEFEGERFVADASEYICLFNVVDD